MAIQLEFDDERGVHYAEAYARIEAYQPNYGAGFVEISVNYWRDAVAAERDSGLAAVTSVGFVAPIAEVNALYQVGDPPDPRVPLYRWLMLQEAFSAGVSV